MLIEAYQPYFSAVKSYHAHPPGKRQVIFDGYFSAILATATHPGVVKHLQRKLAIESNLYTPHAQNQ